jgi:imidazolonepropionase-like amidohydrolase
MTEGVATDLILRNGVALVGGDLTPTPFASLVISGGIISSISNDIVHVNGALELQLEGMYVLPGLIDCHTHFDLAAHAAPFNHWYRGSFVRSLTCFHNGLRALRAGITSVRDLGSVDDLVIRYGNETNSGRVLGPRVVAAGIPIMMTGGHASEHGRVANGVDGIRLAVREQLAAGASAIKFMASGGISTPGNPGAPSLTTEEMAAGVEAAHDAGVLVAAHAHASQGIINAIKAGVDTIEHAAFAGDDAHQLMIERGIILVPTVIALDPIAPGLGIPATTVQKSISARETYRANTAKAIAAGVEIAAGTDAGTAFNPIGDLLNEIKTYAVLGMTPTDALRTATITAGRLVRRVGDSLPVGVIDVGAKADLLVTLGDPRGDLELLRRPHIVIAAGKQVDLGWIEQTLDATAKLLEDPAP